LGTGRLDISGGVSNRTFVTDGTEQKALADYLAAAGSVGPNDTDRPWDLRIQNLAFRADTAAGAQLGDVRFVGNAAEVSFTTLAGKIYRLEFRNGLAGNWTPLDGEVVGDGGVRVLRDADPDPGVRLYRVVAR
jgi:hypothetical protein